MRLRDKVAIITGGANGIGLEAAILFAREGAKVALADFDAATGEKRVQELKQQGLDVEFFQVNVADRSSVDKMVEDVVNHFETIDILVNNAGITRDALLTKMSEEQFQQVLDVNLKGVFNCAQAVVPYMITKGKGKIINTSSVSGVYGNVGQTNYAAAKAAVIGMTKTWAKELGRKGINVNAVAPGFTETSMTAKVPEKVLNQIVTMIPLQRLGKPSDIAYAYLYLASDESNYVNGTVLHVDGGIMM
ncbi:3-oxoacyl-[acyl-carrier protein] reductase [Anoxybacillus calidus]|jgi:3-oxoacyl-[acyl-carrier protein] reductase|uniref:3-oxoacyl-[acyl-carrier-protein] reductase n=1 Tax=[Anoxybacillus] calidus TaxID=575178 RepID=A0A7V9Z1J5_9BACL|nr:3-oxoacyl-ACP reductase FabG [Anoxybacillus calidus]MBA2872399.1 3-oxoacyl-[acyl-carrier protein] reductase [Anoxybacillus calidus]